VRGHHGRPSAAAAAGTGGNERGAGAFADEVAFELGQGGEDVEDEFAAGVVVSIASWRLRKPEAAVGEGGDGVDQVAEGAAEAVELPDDQGVTRPQLVEELLEGEAVGRAPLAVSVNTRLQPAAFRASTWSWGCWSVVEMRA
jgi:hypothetical protein